MQRGEKLMVDRKVTTVIDAEKCIGCELCVKVCPSGTISMIDDKARVTGDRSQQCGHCMAVCPVDAVRVNGIDARSLVFHNFNLKNRWLPHGDFDTAHLVQLMASRRSCRNYTDQAVDRSALQDLVKIATTAPSATNCQNWTFTVLPDRVAVDKLGQRIAAAFRKINRLAEKRLLCKALKLVGKPELENYYHDNYHTVKDGLKAYEHSGRDLLFHGAPAVIVGASRPEGGFMIENALLATQNLLLAAHSMGLGTCLIGYASEVMKFDTSIQQFISIPAEETVCSVIAIGHPDETYEGLTGRKKVVLRYFEG
jgi:nitroreductase/ferredoxin